MASIKVNKGLDLNMRGEPAEEIVDLPNPKWLGVLASEFHNVKAKLMLKQGAKVKVGTPLFYDRYRPELIFTSPGSGTIREIKYGPRRRIDDIIIDLDQEEEFEEFKTYTLDSIAKSDAKELKDNIVKAGVWPVIKQRPFWYIADPSAEPVAVVVSGFSSDPVLSRPEFALNGQEDAIKAGLTALNTIAPGKVHFCLDGEGPADSWIKSIDVDGIQKHYFTGKHPKGLAEVQLGFLRPHRKDEVAWTLDLNSLVRIGRLLLDGKVFTDQVASLGGSAVTKPTYFKTRIGAPIADALKGRIEKYDTRVILGSVFTGRKLEADAYTGFYTSNLSVIAEGNKPKFIGWMVPGFARKSIHRVFASSFFPKSEYDYDTNLNGSIRTMVPIGSHEKVCAPEVIPSFLVKATLAGDIEEMEDLGIHDCAECGLCTFADPSKIEFGQILREGMDMIHSEG